MSNHDEKEMVRFDLVCKIFIIITSGMWILQLLLIVYVDSHEGFFQWLLFSFVWAICSFSMKKMRTSTSTYIAGDKRVIFSMMTMVSKEHLFSAEFPEDVGLEILLRLPVESILRFKCVSKSWYSFLNNPTFIAKHLSFHLEDHIFLTSYCEQTKRHTAYSISNMDDVYKYSDLGMLSPYINKDDAVDSFQDKRIVGICDGLIVISDYEGGEIIICNIATRNFRTLPESYFYPFPINNTQELILDQYGQECQSYISFVGFGYDSKHNDYKILRVLEFWDDVYREVEFPPRAEVFSIGTDTCWREINMTNIRNFSSFNCQGIYLNGSLYCLTLFDTILLSFNIVDERFRNIPLPERSDAHEDDFVSVPEVYNNELAMFIVRFLFTGEGDNSIDVWVMKEFGMEPSWSKVLTIRPIHRLKSSSMTFWKNATLFLYGDHGGLRVVDILRMESKFISLKDDGGFCSVIGPYTKTLVCVNKRK